MMAPPPAERTALIAGATGLVGRAIVRELHRSGGWNVVGIARRPPASQVDDQTRWIAADLTDPESCRRAIADLPDITHVFYAARFDHPENQPELVDTNTRMLRNVVEAVEMQPSLRHIHLVHGTKYYGHQLHEVGLPLREDSPRGRGENYYFNQEDFISGRSIGRPWRYTTSRPHAFSFPDVDHPRSIGLIFAVYACVQRALGRTLDFPGTEVAYHSRTQFTDIALLARAIHWMVDEPRCANGSFNVVNGDTPRWCELWEGFGRFFDVPVGPPRPMNLTEYMQDKGPVWDRIVTAHGLRPTSLYEIALWPYGDYQIRPQWDVYSSMDKARALGFAESVDTHAMFRRQFQHYRKERILPEAPLRPEA